jgi:beta-galactosidase
MNTQQQQQQPSRNLSHLNFVLYGGDYNPEQWPESVWLEDAQLMQEAGVNMVSLAIFSWAKLEPREGEFDFGWLDRVIDVLHTHGIKVDLATATAAPPPWLAKHYPDSLPMTRDGITLFPGSRQQYCPHSTAYKTLAARLVTKIAERYAQHPALAMWHINNEYGCHVSESFTPAGADAFRAWLRAKYASIERLNEAWGTAFWSQRYDDWSEIHPPRTTPTFVNPTQQLDWKRFSSDAILALMKLEVDILRRITPEVPVVTNFMGFFKPLDYWAWAQVEDIVSDDNYPDPMDANAHIGSAMRYDLMRSLRYGQPWLLMEQTPAAVNWRERNAMKKPNQMRLWSYQALARGANGILFFQWRAAKAGAEKFHGAMVPHAGKDTRVFREVAQLGNELKQLSDLVTTTNKAEVAIVFDWENWWALELDSHPSADMNVWKFAPYYAALYAAGHTCDFVPSTVSVDKLRQYKLVVVPNLYLTKAGVGDAFEQYVAEGGHIVIGAFSGIANGDDHIWLGGYPAPFRKLLGIRIEEYEALGAGQQNQIVTDDEESFACETWRDAIQLEGARMLARFGEDFYADAPAITQNAFGKGSAVYVGTCPELPAMQWLMRRLCDEAGVVAPLAAPPGVEVTVREGDGRKFTFVLNQMATPVEVRLPSQMRDVLSGDVREGVLKLAGFGVAVLEA